MYETTRIVALNLLATTTAAAWYPQDVGEQDILEQVSSRVRELGVEGIVRELQEPLANKTLIVSDLERTIHDLEPEQQALLAAAAQLLLTPENIASNHDRWHPGDKDEASRQATSDFLHYRFLFLEGEALLDLDRASEAAKRFEAISPHSRKNGLGLSTHPYEVQLARAYNSLGQHEKALAVITPTYAIAQQEWMRPAFEEAYLGTGRERSTIEAYLAERRAALAVPMKPFESTDYEGNTVQYDALKGDVTLITTWFPGCYGCRLEIPFLQGLLERHAGRGLRVVAVEITRNTAKARAYRKEHYGFATFPFVENGPPSSEVVNSYLGANGNATFLVGKDGKVVLAWAGWGEHLEPELEKRVVEELDREAPLGSRR